MPQRRRDTMQWKKLGVGLRSQRLRPVGVALGSDADAVLDKRRCAAIYAGIRDANGMSRIGWVDVILAIDLCHWACKSPTLDIAGRLLFDDTPYPRHVVRIGDRPADVLRWLSTRSQASSSCLHRRGRKRRWRRHLHALVRSAILDRTDEGLCIRAIHTVLREHDRFRIWYSVGNDWEIIEGKPSRDITFAQRNPPMV